ncbi:sensor histidine kinase [uncultured Pseudoteredinibacter sp.]|uniref:sensor histidine kinase n=1 Tax=uncultured Pseudoteredinibacter sp. TaxID=1641701 RepID=UPI00260FD933|nr:sensor histidine kinase [uncultured Pseudoteredinibacter sp.]
MRQHYRLIPLLTLWLMGNALFAESSNSGSDYEGLFQSGSPYFHELKRDGFETTSILSFAKDHHGRLWMGGRYGIVWYDGFDYHRIKSGDKTVGGQSPIYKLISANEKGMWFLTHRKTVSFYSFSAQREFSDITLKRFQAEDIIAYQGNDLLVASDTGIYKVAFDNKSNNFNITEIYLSKNPVSYISSFQDQIFFSTQDGLFQLNSKGELSALGFTGKISSKLITDPEGGLWFSNEGSLLRLKDQNIDRRVDNIGLITEMVFSVDGSLWAGTRGNGVWQVNPIDGSVIKQHPINSVHGLALGADTINAIYEDNAGIIWLGRFSKPSMFINPERQAIRNIANNPWQPNQILNNSIFYILKHSSERIWLAHSRQGISILRADGGLYAKLDSSNEEQDETLPKGSVYALAEDNSASVYASIGEKGVYKISPDLESVQALGDSKHEIGRKYFNLVFDKKQRLYASGSHGIFRYSSEQNQFEKIDLGKLGPYSSRTNHSFTDKDHNLWFAGKDYIAVIKAGGDSISALLHAGHIKKISGDTRIRYAFPARSQQAMLSFGGKLYQANYHSKKQTIFLQEVPLEQSISGRFFEDDNGQLWSSHENVNIHSGKYRKLGRAEGLLPHIDRYFAQVELTNNRQLHGSAEGLVFLKRDQLRSWRFDTPTVVSKVTIDGQPIDLTANAINHSISVAADTQLVEITAAALDYSAPNQNRYAYRIKGYQDNWIESTYQGRRISLSKLPPGAYLLEIKGSNRVGEWGRQTLKLSLKILPAWYETYWFLIALIILALLLLYLLYRWRVQQLTNKQKWLEETVKERTSELNESLDNLQKTQNQLIESEKQASLGRLVRGVSHELNTPIGILKSSNSGLQHLAKDTQNSFDSGQLTEQKLKSLMKNTISSSDLMAKNIERMAQLTSRFKQSAAEELPVEKQAIYLYKILEASLASVKGKLDAHNVDVHIDCDKTLLLDSYPVVLKNIISEILSNSLYHGFSELRKTTEDIDRENQESPHSTIKIRVRHHSDNYKITISDNGRGMSASEREQIFEPFHTSSQEAERIGLGMHSVFNWVNQILKARIICRSLPNKGTAIVLILPVNL